MVEMTWMGLEETVEEMKVLASLSAFAFVYRLYQNTVTTTVHYEWQ